MGKTKYNNNNTINLTFANSVVRFLLEAKKEEKERRAFEEERMKKEEAEKRAYEEAQIAKGLVKFVDRSGNEKWGTSEEVAEWKRIDDEEREKEKLINRVIAEINGFRPAREQLHNEYAYQLSLHQWLKRVFPSAVIEEQRGRSRPDIVIDNIAIEVKGPTGHNALNTIATKCMMYAGHFPDGIIIVLFEMNVSDEYFSNWRTALEKKFPGVIVIPMS